VVPPPAACLAVPPAPPVLPTAPRGALAAAGPPTPPVPGAGTVFPPGEGFFGPPARSSGPPQWPAGHNDSDGRRPEFIIASQNFAKFCLCNWEFFKKIH
jgi:hypothetical protein